MAEIAGRYSLGEVLGTGGTATVYRATDTALGVERAVKVLRGDGTGIDAQRGRLRSEARAMARVTHPNILRVYDVGHADGQDYFVMDLAEGGSLQDRVDDEGPLSPVVACRYALQILGALAAAHDAGVIHRDVKPQNVLLDRDGIALLADFGIALLSDGRESRQTSVGVAMGSMTYMPPEQRLDASGVGVGADIYSTGATLYAVLTGASPVDLFLAPTGSARWDDVPDVLCPILQRATALEPEERYPSARHMAAALLTAMALLPAEPAPSARDDAAWVWVRDRVLASLSGPGSDPDTSPEAGPRVPRPRRGGNVAPTLDGRAAAALALRSRERITAGLLLLLLFTMGIAVWLRSTPSEPGGAAASAPVAIGSRGVDTPETPPAEVVQPAPTATVVAAAAPPVKATPAPHGGAAASAVKQRRVYTSPSAVAVEAPAVAPVSPVGVWTGSFNGRSSQLQLSGTNDTLRGTVTITFQGNAIVNEVEGRFDPTARKVELADIERSADSGSYVATLTDEPALDGTFRATETGQVVRFRLVPAR